MGRKIDRDKWVSGRRVGDNARDANGVMMNRVAALSPLEIGHWVLAIGYSGCPRTSYIQQCISKGQGQWRPPPLPLLAPVQIFQLGFNMRKQRNRGFIGTRLVRLLCGNVGGMPTLLGEARISEMHCVD